MGVGRSRGVLLAVLGGAALAMAITGAARAGGNPKNLTDFLPARLGDAHADPATIPGPDRVTRMYSLKGNSDAAPHYVTVTLIIGPDESELAEALAVRKVGETRPTDSGLDAVGLRIDGRFVQRACGLYRTRCVVDVVLARRMLLVHMDLERPTDNDEVLRWLKRLDLRGMEAFARKQGAAIDAAHRRSEEQSVQDAIKAFGGGPQGGLSR
jgi:hypothetical protein